MRGNRSEVGGQSFEVEGRKSFVSRFACEPKGEPE
jgi:hypothetical protein